MNWCPRCQQAVATETETAYQGCREHPGCALLVLMTVCAACLTPLHAHSQHVAYAR